MELEEEFDTHFCVNCQSTIVGLMNYITHKKSLCPARSQTFTPSNSQNNPSSLSTNSLNVNVNHQLQELNVNQQQLNVNEQQLNVNHQDLNVNHRQNLNDQTINVNQEYGNATINSNHSNPHQGLDVDVPDHVNAFVEGCLSPSSNVINPNMILEQNTNKNVSDFFSSLELKSKETFDQNDDEHDGEVDDLSDIDLPDEKSLRIANILTDLGFSSDSENYNSDFYSDLDSDSDCGRPPQSGGKWKPGSGPYSGSGITRVRWRPGGKQARHRGKWLPHGKQITNETTEDEGPTVREEPTGGKKWSSDIPIDQLKNVNSDSDSSNDEDNNPAFERNYKPMPLSKKRKLQSTKKSNLSSDEKENYCDICAKAFKSPDYLKIHIRTAKHLNSLKTQPNSGESPREEIRPKQSFVCTICDKTIEDKYNMAKHLMTTYHQRRAMGHPDKFKYIQQYQLAMTKLSPQQCGVCNFYCNTAETLQVHMKSQAHNDKCCNLLGPLLCVLCNYKCDTNTEMLNHIQSAPHTTTAEGSKRPCTVKECRYRIRCKLCDKAMHSASKLLSHMQSKHSVDSSLTLNLGRRRGRNCPKCPYCAVECQSVFAMTVHIRRKHTKERPFKCEPCQTQFCDKYTLSLHKKSKSHLRIMYPEPPVAMETEPEVKKRGRGRPKLPFDPNRSKCNKCDYVAPTYQALRPHYIKVHGVGLQGCEICGISLPKQYLAKHRKSRKHIHNQELRDEGIPATKCRYCSKLFYQKTDKDENCLLTHEQLHFQSNTVLYAKYKDFFDNIERERTEEGHEVLGGRGGSKKVNCPECDKSLCLSYIVTHLNIHNDISPFMCKFPGCKKTMHDPGQYLMHKRLHLQDKRYECPQCDLTFIRKAKMNEHIDRKHFIKTEDSKFFICSFCGKECVSQQQLKAHERTHSKFYACSFSGCSTRFADKAALIAHARVHTGERPFLCDLCGYRGKLQQQLTRHRRTHTGEKNFHCEYCQYKATNSTNLARHMKSHTGASPYKCLYCDHSSRTLENFRKHILKTNRHPNAFVYVCQICAKADPPCGEGCSTNDTAVFKRHLMEAHSSIIGNTPESAIICGLYSGIYDPRKDIRKVPEGSKALPLPERQPRQMLCQPVVKKKTNEHNYSDLVVTPSESDIYEEQLEIHSLDMLGENIEI
ncbi:unnamed protein product [Owenia fusiformis]|uniref:Uncharacterized protein n=1 Tax=Owenia fusiformis TaxID=6347 RepID=A0A8J1TU44_OWEFU|nr:unnamed protein product [Owenia fusiformis]